MTALEPFPEPRGVRWPGDPAADLDAAMLAHDIRGALHGVVGGVAMLDVPGLPEDLATQVARVAASTRSLAGLIERAFGAEAGAIGLQEDTTRIDEFLAFMEQRWAGEARAAGARFEAAGSGDLPERLNLAPMSLTRMAGNLVSNAIRHAAPGPVRLTVARAARGGIDIVVRDHGPGLPAEFRHRDAGDGMLVLAGTHGLGLRIVRSLAAEAGGELVLRNADAGGTEAVVWLPEHAVAAAPLRVAEAGAGGAEALAGARVLLAEDNPTNQMVARQMLDALGAEVTICGDGIEALDAFSRDEFDLVIVDIEMPRMSGLDVIRSIRARGDGRGRVPVVALTAYALREHRDRIARAGANDLISKPITSVAEFGRSLAAHLGQARGDAWGEARTPGGAEAEGDVAVIDRPVFDALVETMGDAIGELLEKVVADLEAARDALLDALGPQDAAAVRSASHILISVAGAIGAVALQSRARGLNKISHAGWDGVGERIPGCVAEIEAAVSFATLERAARMPASWTA
jgi:two-component system, OmpR family, aerobic respiration control sensor histidine kinase ArcB